MFENHPTAQDFEGFLRSTSRPAGSTRNPQVLRHLLADCPACRGRLGALGGSQQHLRLLSFRDGESLREGASPPAAGNGYDYDRAFAVADRAVAALLDQERPGEIPANALRVCGRPREAEEAFATAQVHRLAGTGDPALRAWLFEKITPLHVFRERYGEAVELCEQAGQIYHDLGERHLQASTLVQKAVACVYSGETVGAIRSLNQAIPLIDHDEDPHLLLAACHNLIRCYIDLGRPDQALMLYSETQDLYHELDDTLILLRALWQEGQLLRDLGHLRAAEAALLRARKGFLEDDLIYEVALVSLDLAAVYVKLGLVEELRDTVATTLPVFRSLRVERKMIASLLQLQQVADQEYQAL